MHAMSQSSWKKNNKLKLMTSSITKGSRHFAKSISKQHLIGEFQKDWVWVRGILPETYTIWVQCLPNARHNIMDMQQNIQAE